MFRTTLFTTGIITLLTVCLRTEAAEEISRPKVAEKGAMRVIESNAKLIAMMAYPTTDYTGVECDGGYRYGDGSFTLVYNFKGESSGTRGDFTMKFQFEREGKLIAIKNGPRSWIFEPFTEYELIRAVIVDFGGKDLDNNPQLKKLLKNGSGKAIVMGILNAKSGY